MRNNNNNNNKNDNVVTLQDYNNKVENQWCPGCYNFAILTALKRALVELQKKPEEICLVSGIGQAAKTPQYLRCNYFNGLHGRALSVATGVCAANPHLTTIVTTGDGDCYGEGGNHFLHTIRRNPKFTLIVHNNQIYGLTKGQASPTTDKGDRTRLQMSGVENYPLRPLALAIIQGCTFVARGFTGDIPHLAKLFVEAIKHPAFSYIDVIQPCIIWGTRSMNWYKERVYQLPADFDPSDKQAALAKAMEWEDKIPVGIIYKAPADPVFADRFRSEVGADKLYEAPPPDRSVIREVLNSYC